MITHEQISKRAREIWEREGRPEGRDKEHWLQAESELRRASEQGQNEAGVAVEQSAPVQASGETSSDENSRKRLSRRAR
jgi:hypothetical protein